MDHRALLPVVCAMKNLTKINTASVVYSKFIAIHQSTVARKGYNRGAALKYYCGNNEIRNIFERVQSIKFGVVLRINRSKWARSVWTGIRERLMRLQSDHHCTDKYTIMLAK